MGQQERNQYEERRRQVTDSAALQVIDFLRPDLKEIREDIKAVKAEVNTVHGVARATEQQARATNGRVTALEQASDAEKDERIKSLQAELEKIRSSKRGLLGVLEGRAETLLFAAVFGMFASFPLFYLFLKHPEIVSAIGAGVVKRITNLP